MKVIRQDNTYSRQNVNVRRSIDMAIDRLEQRLSTYVDDQGIEAGKIFGDDVLIHDIINKKYYVFKTKVNQMQIRILYTVEDDKLIILSHWYKNRTNNYYITYFKELVSNF